MRPSAVPGASPAGSLLLYSAYAQAAGTALIAVLAIAAATVLITRKRITWHARLDIPLSPGPVAAPGPQPQVTRWSLAGDPAGVVGEDQAWLAVLAVTNSGFAPVRGRDFTTPLTFTFPGRQVRGIQILPEPPAPSTPPPEVQALPGPGSDRSQARIAPSGDFLLRPGHGYSLMLLLGGQPEAAARIGHEGSLAGGKILTGPGGEPARWLACSLCAVVFLAALLLGLFLGPGVA